MAGANFSQYSRSPLRGPFFWGRGYEPHAFHIKRSESVDDSTPLAMWLEKIVFNATVGTTIPSDY
jgi:hypothetical protein